MNDPRERVVAAFDRVRAHDDPSVFLALADRDDALARLGDGPLAGVTFAVKDNIDVAGLPTTVAFPPAARVAERSAPCVTRLEAAGATCLGKTNLDQFATGLTGARSPYGTPRNPVDPQLVPGGSSSGSAVAVAAGLVDLALGTDTAGSGRVPAAQCRIVGAKPTRGLVTTSGVVPAVRALDCVSVFARDVGAAAEALSVLAGYDPDDPWSRAAPADPAPPVRRIGIPAETDLDGPLDAAAWAASVDALAALPVELVEVDPGPLLDAGELLYGGPFVAARVDAIGALADLDPTALDPSVAEILAGARTLTAAAAYRGEHDLAVLRRRAERAWAGVDALFVPTTPGPATVEEVATDPLGRNARLGAWTNGANLLDLAAVAVPGVDRADGRPFGVSVLGRAWTDGTLLALAARFRAEPVPSDPIVAAAGPAAVVELVVVGAHLRGLPLEHQLTDLGATFVEETSTAPRYRLYALAGTVPPKPGLVHVGHGGAAIAAEVWRLPTAAVGYFLAGIPAPLALGTVELAGGRTRHGFVCEPRAVAGATDVTAHGGWRAYLEGRPPSTP